jgi:tetratricopeptide (TPR) repeat protein
VAVGIEAAAGFIFAVGGLIAFAPIVRRGRRRALIAPLTLYSTQALWFVVPIVVGWMSSLSEPQTRYSSGMLAVMHAAQYLWITRYFARRDAEQSGRLGSWNVWAYWSTLVIGGLALFLPVPWLASFGWHVDFTASVFIVASIVNIHHFMIDGVVWKLRNPRVGQMLVGESSAAPGVGAATPPAPMPQLARRRVLTASRYAAVAPLLILAAVDQWRYRLAIGPGDRDGLEAATRINPYDSGAYLRLAQAAGRAGDAASAEAAVRRAIAANPHNPIPARALVQLLIESNRLPDAYAQAQAVLASWPGDVDTLVNAGVLAYRLNDMVAAEQSWRRALDQDPSQRAVHLYLAERLDARGALAEALPYYRRYLELAVSSDADDRPPAAEVVPAVLRFADALARQGDRGAALSQYDLAVRMARQTGLGDIERIAQERRDAIAGPR